MKGDIRTGALQPRVCIPNWACLCAAALIGFVAGNAILSLAYPRSDAIGIGQVSADHEGPDSIVKGRFNRVDEIHVGQGTASVYDADDGYTIEFKNFRVTEGPDLHVWLVAHPNPSEEEHVLENEYIALGALQSRTGPQSYAVPAGTDFAEYESVIIWCEELSVLFSTASLR
jgi:hypothetical protein